MNTKQTPGWGMAEYCISNGTEACFRLNLKGRVRWAMECLIAAGPKGCTPIDNPGPRWSAYVFDLRELNVQIETIHEPHGEPFSGTHARYVLQSTVSRGCNSMGAA
jgi:hypothetical protein